MKRQGVLHPQLSRVLAETGHTDILTICDQGFPVPLGVERVDLALTADIPTVLDVLKTMDSEFIIDTIIVTEEMQRVSPERFDQIRTQYPHVNLKIISHAEFKRICPESRAVIRTGDSVPYANIMIVSG